MVSRNAILVANSFVARLFEWNSLQQPWVEIQDWWHAESRMHPGELERALPGHSLAGRSGLAPRSDVRQRERAEFAQDVAQGLQLALDTDKWQTLEIFASNPFLGELLAHLSPAVRASLHATHPLDLTALPASVIEHRCRQAFNPGRGLEGSDPIANSSTRHHR